MEASLYIHIPFCKKKCDYCHFYVIPDKDDHKTLLLKGLSTEWELIKHNFVGKKIVSVYFGGGTPALFGPDRIEHLLSLVSNISPDCEITLEANPENITRDLMSAYKQAGINRVSIGVQSLNENLLTVLSREHSAKKAIDAIHGTYEAGIENISIDLMYDLPGQSLKMWENTLLEACRLPIKHLSLYNLTIEPRTVYYKKRDSLEKLLPSHEDSKEMYEMALAKFDDAGLKQYEISAFARDGAYSRHNIGYWQGRPFLGMGPSAFSYWKGKRFRNIENLNKYCKMLENGESPVDFQEDLVADAKVRELLVIGIRILEGVNLDNFPVDNSTLQSIESLMQDGFLKKANNQLKLTSKGILFYDTIASQLI